MRWEIWGQTDPPTDPKGGFQCRLVRADQPDYKSRTAGFSFVWAVEMRSEDEAQALFREFRSFNSSYRRMGAGGIIDGPVMRGDPSDFFPALMDDDQPDGRPSSTSAITADWLFEDPE